VGFKLSRSQKDPGSEIGKKIPDPDPGGKNTRSATLLKFVPQNQILVPFRIMVFSLKKIASKI
jgi:hypothetical protein